jgi:cytochrome c-type biogenesis protein CcmH
MTAVAALAVLILVGTVLYLAWPLKRAADAGNRERYHQFVQQRDRLLAQLNELDVEEGDRTMDAAVATDERARLEAELAQVLRQIEVLTPGPAVAATPVPRRTRIVTVAAIAIFLPLIAVGLYAGKQGQTLEQAALLGPGGPPDPVAMVARLEKRLSQQPGDVAGWVRLGRAYVALERAAEARAAFARAAAAAPDDAEVLTEYATFLIAENPRHPSPEAVTVFRRIQQLNPKHPGALWVLGLEAYNAGRHAQAVQYWEQLRRELPPDSEVEPMIRQALAEARARLRR